MIRPKLCGISNLLVAITAAAEGFLPQAPEHCEDAATRRIAVSLPGPSLAVVTVDVCLRHSLVAHEHHDAHLLAVLSEPVFSP